MWGHLISGRILKSMYVMRSGGWQKARRRNDMKSNLEILICFGFLVRYSICFIG